MVVWPGKVKAGSQSEQIVSSVDFYPTLLEATGRIARVAGVHLYIETEDVVWAAREMLAVSVYEPGTRTVRLPRTATVQDLYSGEQVAAAARSFEARFEACATRLFALR